MSDAQLVEATRRGESDAFDVLFRRHYPDACHYAVRVAGPEAAPERVAEAFAHVYRAMLNGKGPDTNFRAYLFSSVRNAHVDVVRRRRKEVPVDDLGAELASEQDVEDDVLTRMEASPIRRAFAALRPTWRTVLWHTVVLGETHERVAELMDTTPNNVAVLSFRAREGLRQAYLAEHVRASDDKACGRAAPYLPRYVRGQLGPKREQAVAEHVESCRACAAAVVDLAEINSNLGAVLTPAVLLGVPGLVTGGVAAKGVLAGLLLRFTDTGKVAAGATGVAVAATAAVAVGLVATAGPDRQAPPAAGAGTGVESSAPAESPRRAVPPPRTPGPTERSTRPAPVVASAAPSPAERPTPAPRTPASTPTVEPEAAEPPAGTEAPRPAPAIVEEDASVFGGGLVRHARVGFALTPRSADALVVTVRNARVLAVTGGGIRCPARFSSDEETFECGVPEDAPATFSVVVHVTFADASRPVTGSVALRGADGAAVEDFTVPVD